MMTTETTSISGVDRFNKESIFGTVTDSYRQSGFDAGYRRAANDLLADFLLLASKLRSDLGRTEPLSHERLDDLRDFERQLEQAADGLAGTERPHTYVDGGLGI